jgi:rfaE bifunctional protein nucleotidyltransferase chain/domain
VNKFDIGKVIPDWSELFALRTQWKADGLKIIFTNGVFDILHRGHLDYLIEARKCGDLLVVGINTDSSVTRLKGPKRPLIKQQDRAFALSCLRPVNVVTFFDQDTPLDLITSFKPDVLVKGADYTEDQIVGAKEVKATGGEVIRIPLTENRSSSGLIEKIIERYQND